MITRALENASQQPIQVNTDLMMLAIEWKLDESGEVIERIFSIDKIDCGMTGNWDEVRKELHVQGLGLPMPEKPQNSMDDFRRKVGVGCFSHDPIFRYGEIQDVRFFD